MGSGMASGFRTTSVREAEGVFPARQAGAELRG